MRQTQKTSSSNKRSKTPGTTAVIMVLTSVVSDPIRRRHSICRRPGVLDRVMEELFFCIYLMRVAGLLKKRLRTHFASSCQGEELSRSEIGNTVYIRMYCIQVWKYVSLNHSACNSHSTKFASNTCSTLFLAPSGTIMD